MQSKLHMKQFAQLMRWFWIRWRLIFTAASIDEGHVNKIRTFRNIHNNDAILHRHAAAVDPAAVCFVRVDNARSHHGPRGATLPWRRCVTIDGRRVDGIWIKKIVEKLFNLL